MSEDMDTEDYTRDRLGNLKSAGKNLYRGLTKKMRRWSSKGDPPLEKSSQTKSEPAISKPLKITSSFQSAPTLLIATGEEDISKSCSKEIDSKSVEENPVNTPLKQCTKRAKSVVSDKLSPIDIKDIEIPPYSDLEDNLPLLVKIYDRDERMELFVKKLGLCRIRFHFDAHTKHAMRLDIEQLEMEKAQPERKTSRPSQQEITLHEEIQHDSDSETTIALKRAKSQILFEIADFISFSSGWFSVKRGREVVNTIAVNIFRDLPGSERTRRMPGDNFVYLDPAWAHLNIVYEILLRMVCSNTIDVKMLKKCITRGFVGQLMKCFQSQDHREREYVKNILHRIYGKFTSYRLFIRKTIQNEFLMYIYETDCHYGIAEILEMLGSIINGCGLPLKEIHKSLLMDCLIPLHKTSMFPDFQSTLVHCLIQYIEKDPSLTPQIINGILHFWPFTRSDKAVLFFLELEELLEVLEPNRFPLISTQLCKCLSSCMESDNSQIAERCLHLWNNQLILPLLMDNSRIVFPLIFGSLAGVSQTHWSFTVRTLALSVLGLYIDHDQELYNECFQRYAQTHVNRQVYREQRRKMWKELEQETNM